VVPRKIKLKYGTLYGPIANQSNSIYRYLSQALKGRKITVPGDGEELREYIHVRDAAKLSAEVIDQQYRNRHIIITGHQAMKFKYLITMMREILNNQIDVEYWPGTNPAHYAVTPYSYIPKIGSKLTSNCYIDMGQGLLECLHEMDR
jgi:UDP-glucose 4-epimerase